MGYIAQYSKEKNLTEKYKIVFEIRTAIRIKHALPISVYVYIYVLAHASDNFVRGRHPTSSFITGLCLSRPLY